MFIRQLRVATRNLAKSPRFTFVAVATLALGIGASTAMYSFLSGVLLAPLPWQDSDSLLILSKGNPNFGFEGMWPSSMEWQRFADGATHIDSLSGYGQRSTDLFTEDGGKRLWIAEVLPGLLEMVGREPVLGRNFSAEEFAEGQASVAVLSNQFWLDQFGGDEGAIGKTLDLDEGQHVIIGVMPPGPTLPLMQEAPVVVPARWTEADRTERDSGRFVLGIARLRPGASLEIAREELATLQQGLESEKPSGMDGWRPELRPLARARRRRRRAPLWILLAPC